jgi:hypothetical protein
MKYKTNEPHLGDDLMIVLRQDNVDLSRESTKHKLTQRDAVYFFCSCVEPLGYVATNDSILEYYSNETGDHGCVGIIVSEGGSFDFSYRKAKANYTYGYCKVYPAKWAHEHGYPKKLRIKPPVYKH